MASANKSHGLATGVARGGLNAILAVRVARVRKAALCATMSGQTTHAHYHKH